MNSPSVRPILVGVVIVLLAVLGWQLFPRKRPDVPPVTGTIPPPSASSTPPTTGGSHADWFVLRNIMMGFEIAYPPPVDQVDLGGGEFHIGDADGKDWWIAVRVLPDSYQWTDESSCPDLVRVGGESLHAERTTIGDTSFCVSTTREGAAGSTYEDAEYVAKAWKGFVAIQLVARHVTDVRIYGGCETEADLQKDECKKLQWDEARDTAIFTEILKTYRVIPSGS